jgi:N-acetylneuraminic acid mutarotase
MDKYLCLYLLLLAMSCKEKTEVVPAPVTNSSSTTTTTVNPLLPTGWKKMPDFNGGTRANAISVAIGTKLYVGFGYNSNVGFAGVSNDFYEFDTSIGVWKKLESLPGEGRANAVAFAIKGKIYAGLGTNYNRIDIPTIYNDFYEFDPTKNTWTRKNDLPFIATDQPVSFVINDKGYFGTGNSPANTPNTTGRFYEYDPETDKWKSVATMPQNICRGMSFTIGGKAYVGGGENDNMEKLDFFYEFDPIKNTWLAKKSLPLKISRAVGFEANGSGYMIGGLATKGDFSENDIYKYNIATDTWSKEGQMAAENEKLAGRFYPSAMKANDKVYIGIGSYSWQGANLKDFYEWAVK